MSAGPSHSAADNEQFLGTKTVLLDALKHEFLTHDLLTKRMEDYQHKLENLKELLNNLKTLASRVRPDLNLDEFDMSNADESFLEQRKKLFRMACKPWLCGEIKCDDIQPEPLTAVEKTLVEFLAQRGEPPPTFLNPFLTRNEKTDLMKIATKNSSKQSKDNKVSSLEVHSTVLVSEELEEEEMEYLDEDDEFDDEEDEDMEFLEEDADEIEQGGHLTSKQAFLGQHHSGMDAGEALTIVGNKPVHIEHSHRHGIDLGDEYVYSEEEYS